MFYFPCSPVHKICLLFTELNNEDKHIFRDSELRKQSDNFKQTQRKQINILSCKPVYNLDLPALCQTK
jgi:hypothetical protein